MSIITQQRLAPDEAEAPLVGAARTYAPQSELHLHAHERHQLMYSTKGVMHVSTATGRWILPPTKALWVSGGTPHAFLAKRPVELLVLWVRQDARGTPPWDGCVVVNVSPLVRELITACTAIPWEYDSDSRHSRLGHTLLDQLELHEQAPLELPDVTDPRAVRVADLVRSKPADRRTLMELAAEAGASHRTIERIFAAEAKMSFGRWRVRHRMIMALEQLAHGESVGNVAFAVGYESPSSFIAAFRETFRSTPTAYFQETSTGYGRRCNTTTSL